MSDVTMILRKKGAEVVTARMAMSILDAAQLMNKHKIGCLVVTADRDPSEIAGILTERDILTRLVASERDPRRTNVADIMTRDVRCCTPRTSVDELRTMMQAERIRHVPVCDGTALCGLVSIGDVNALEADGMSQTIMAMEEYISRG